MINNSDFLIICVNYFWSVAHITLSYAQNKNFKIINLSIEITIKFFVI